MENFDENSPLLLFYTEFFVLCDEISSTLYVLREKTIHDYYFIKVERCDLLTAS